VRISDKRITLARNMETSVEIDAGRPGLRARRASDDAALLSIFNDAQFQARAATREPFASVAEIGAWLEGLSKRRFEAVCAWNDEVVGFAGLYPMEDRLDHVGWILLGVRSDHHGRGLGTALLKTLLLAADFTIGLRRVQLTVFADNAPAIALYARNGFVIEGRHGALVRRDESYIDALTMARISDPQEFVSNREAAQLRMNEIAPLWRESDAG
jgi:L-phenylalanine/L-methionine N-acetyltransferase